MPWNHAPESKCFAFQSIFPWQRLGTKGHSLGFHGTGSLPCEFPQPCSWSNTSRYLFHWNTWEPFLGGLHTQHLPQGAQRMSKSLWEEVVKDFGLQPLQKGTVNIRELTGGFAQFSWSTHDISLKIKARDQLDSSGLAQLRSGVHHPVWGSGHLTLRLTAPSYIWQGSVEE